MTFQSSFVSKKKKSLFWGHPYWVSYIKVSPRPNPMIHNFVICTLLSRIRGKQPLRGGATKSWSSNQKKVTLLELWASHLLHLIIITPRLTPSLWISVVWGRRCKPGRDWGVSIYHRNITHPHCGHFQVPGRTDYRRWTIVRLVFSITQL